MRGWTILYSLLSAGSLGAMSLGDTSYGIKGLGAVALLLTALTVLTGIVRGRA